MDPHLIALLDLLFKFAIVPGLVMLWKIDRRLYRVELHLFPDSDKDA